MKRRTALVLNDTGTIPHHGCRTVMANLRAGLAAHGIDVGFSVPVARDWRSVAGFDAALAAADLVVINGEGTVHHDQPRARTLMEAAGAARSAGKPVALVNALFESISPEWAPLFADLDAVFLRDRQSVAEFGETTGRKAHYCPDLSLHGGRPAEAGNDRSGGIVFGDSAVKAVRTALFERFRQTPGSRYIPIRSTRFAGRGVVLDTVDSAAARINAVYYRLRYGAYESYASAQAYQAAISPAPLHVTGRFHAACLSLKLGIPFLVVQSNSRKCRALIDDCGLDPARHLSAPPEGRLDPSEFAFSPLEQSAMTAFFDDAAGRYARMFETVAAL